MEEPRGSSEYFETLTLYYEEEVEGAAYFDRLAERLQHPDQKEKMHLMARVEDYAAASVLPLLHKHALTPRDASELAASGRAQADALPAEWADLIADMRKTFPDYIDDFERLEAMAPPQDLPALKVLTAHEIAAIAFLDREATGDPKSTEPMHHYLKTGTA